MRPRPMINLGLGFLLRGPSLSLRYGFRGRSVRRIRSLGRCPSVSAPVPSRLQQGGSSWSILRVGCEGRE